MTNAPNIATLGDIVPFRAQVSPTGLALHELDREGRLVVRTFAELARSVESFAARLAACAVGPGSKVAILMPNCRQWVVACHAIFRLGAVAVPLEYALLAAEPDRIRHALRDAGADAVVCAPPDAGAAHALVGPGCKVISATLKDATVGPAPPRPDVRPSDLALILYTSGTTGPGKGVELTHSNVMFDMRQCLRRFGMSRRDCLPALLPYHHAYPLTTTVLLPPFVGAAMAVGDITAHQARELLRLCRPTVLVAVPRMLEAMLEGIHAAAERAGQGERLRRALGLSALAKRATGLNVGRLLFRRLHRRLFGGLQLRFCVSGGARISPRTLREFFLLGIPVVQGWGMTELSPVAAVQPFSALRFYLTRHYERKAGSIGPPLEGTAIRLFRSAGEASDFEEKDRGEMVVSGPHVMRGYHNDPDLTRRLMTPQGLRTGDIARRDRDGNLYIIGRAKHVIVLPNGKKVFPEQDLEEELSRCALVEEFTVRAAAGEDGAETIGIIVRPRLEELKCRGIRTLGALYVAVKHEIDAALEGKADYMRRYELCLTRPDREGFAELVKTAIGKPCPLKNPFLPDAAYRRMKHSTVPVPR